MKKIAVISLLLMLLVCIVSAGCLSFSTTSADIIVGEQKIGTITVTPNNDKLYTDSGIEEKFDVVIDVLGLKYSKDGISLSEKNELLSTISNKGIEEVNLDSFTKTTATPESIIDAIANMQISNENKTTLAEAMGNAGNTFNERIEAIKKLLEDE